MNHLTIFFEADDVAENLTSNWVSLLNKRYGTDVAPENIVSRDIEKAFPELTKDQIFGLLEEDEVWKTLEPMPGSQEYLQKLFDEGHDLYLVTALNHKSILAKIDRIKQHFPFLDNAHIIFTSKKQLLLGDVLIDNIPQNLIGGRYFRILFDQPYNRAFLENRYGMWRVFGWKEVYDTIHKELAFLDECTFAQR